MCQARNLTETIILVISQSCPNLREARIPTSISLKMIRAQKFRHREAAAGLRSPKAAGPASRMRAMPAARARQRPPPMQTWRRRQVGVAQNQPGGVTQVLVHVSTYQGSILVPVFRATAKCQRVGEVRAVGSNVHRISYGIRSARVALAQLRSLLPVHQSIAGLISRHFPRHPRFPSQEGR